MILVGAKLQNTNKKTDEPEEFICLLISAAEGTRTPTPLGTRS